MFLTGFEPNMLFFFGRGVAKESKMHPSTLIAQLRPAFLRPVLLIGFVRAAFIWGIAPRSNALEGGRGNQIVNELFFLNLFFWLSRTTMYRLANMVPI